eukprot:TRINITY_DN39131_c0_g1_i1.p1 TRINITY_DN39131_c0_g1~~TRINITY_DN39131_c0_g1_i1.p1  ORF type:complete len:387 (+),score=116.83 TRINITY_DN39131_c0_g1_i1:58-1218(+)
MVGMRIARGALGLMPRHSAMLPRRGCAAAAVAEEAKPAAAMEKSPPRIDHEQFTGLQTLAKRLFGRYTVDAGNMRKRRESVTRSFAAAAEEAIRACDGHQEKTANYALQMLCLSGDLPRATELYQQLRQTGVRLQALTYRLLLVVHAREGIVGMEDFIREIHRAGKKPDGAMVLQIAILYARAGSPDKALQLTRDLLRLGGQPDLKTVCPALMKAANSAKMWHEVRELGKEAGVEPDVTGWMRLLEVTPNDECEAVLEQMKEAGMGVHERSAYNTLLGKHQVARDFQKMVETYQTMRRLGHEPNMKTFRTLIRGAADQVRRTVITGEDPARYAQVCEVAYKQAKKFEDKLDEVVTAHMYDVYRTLGRDVEAEEIKLQLLQGRFGDE